MSRPKNILIIAVIIAAVIIIKLISVLGNGAGNSQSPVENHLRKANHLILTKHAKCRMECRHITLEEIKEILQAGNENYAKSGEGSRGDKTYAFEGYSSDRQHIRVVVTPENNEVVVITCIDLDKEWPCNCN